MRDGAAATYVVAVRDSRVSLGHGMCSGPFVLDSGVEYDVTLTAIDLAGNEAPAPGGPVRVIGPS